MNILNQETTNQSGSNFVMPNQSETSIPKNYSAVTRWWMPYKYLTLAEKFFLFINILGLLLLFFSLFVGISRVIQGKYYSFGLGNSIFLFAIMQSLPALRYRGLTRIPTDKLDEKLQNQIAQWCKFKWMYSLKFSVFCWLLWVGLSAFSLYLIFQVFP